MGCHAFLQGIFPIQGLNPLLLHLLQVLYLEGHLGNPCFPLDIKKNPKSADLTTPHSSCLHPIHDFPFPWLFYLHSCPLQFSHPLAGIVGFLRHGSDHIPLLKSPLALFYHILKESKHLTRPLPSFPALFPSPPCLPQSLAIPKTFQIHALLPHGLHTCCSLCLEYSLHKSLCGSLFT